MNLNDFDGRRGPARLGHAALAAVEAELGCRFPDAYRAGMLKRNGGFVPALGPGWELVPIRDDSARKAVARTWDDVVRQTCAFRREFPWFPQDAVVLATIDGNCLLLRPGPLGGPELEDEVHAWFADGEAGHIVFGSTAEMMDVRE